MGYDEDTYDALYWVIIGVLEVLVTYAILRPLEALRPVETWQDRKAVRADVFYTWIAKLGIINLAFFFLLRRVFNHWQSLMAIHDIPNLEIDSLWPGVTDQPVVSFLIYLIVLDFAGYWYHRWQHRFGVWWELHAVHHSQQQMSLWADDRNHFLDDIIQAAFFASDLALHRRGAVAVRRAGRGQQCAAKHPARERPLAIRAACSTACSSVRCFIGVITRLAMVTKARVMAATSACCFRGGTCCSGRSWNPTVEPTGIRDQLPAPDAPGRDYGNGFVEQHWLAFKRIGERAVTSVKPASRNSPSKPTQCRRIRTLARLC